MESQSKKVFGYPLTHPVLAALGFAVAAVSTMKVLGML